MSPQVLSRHVAALAILAVLPAAPSFAATAEAGASQKSTSAHPLMAQKQLVSGTDCQSAATARSKSDFLSSSAEARDDVLITIRYCDATAHNQLHPTKPEIVVVSGDPYATGDAKIFFKTLPKDDAKKVHDTCLLAGKATFAYLQATAAATSQAGGGIAGADVLTSSGKTDCESFLGATAPDNPLVVLAPSVISGYAISVHILDMIGMKKPPTEVQAAVDSLGQQVAASVALSADDVRKHPQIVLKP
jgi:hypothetical protein